MEIYFLRHGLAGEPGSYANDAERPLTKEGRERMEKAARGMRKLDLKFDVVLSSPYVRARQTAEIAAKGVGFQDDSTFTQTLIPDAPFAPFRQDLEALPRSAASVLAVGHMPSLAEFVSALTAEGALRLEFKKGALCLVELAHAGAAVGRLRWLLTSAQLRSIG